MLTEWSELNWCHLCIIMEIVSFSYNTVDSQNETPLQSYILSCLSKHKFDTCWHSTEKILQVCNILCVHCNSDCENVFHCDSENRFLSKFHFYYHFQTFIAYFCSISLGFLSSLFLTDFIVNCLFEQKKIWGEEKPIQFYSCYQRYFLQQWKKPRRRNKIINWIIMWL